MAKYLPWWSSRDPSTLEQELKGTVWPAVKALATKCQYYFQQDGASCHVAAPCPQFQGSEFRLAGANLLPCIDWRLSWMTVPRKYLYLPSQCYAFRILCFSLSTELYQLLLLQHLTATSYVFMHLLYPFFKVVFLFRITWNVRRCELTRFLSYPAYVIRVVY